MTTTQPMKTQENSPMPSTHNITNILTNSESFKQYKEYTKTSPNESNYDANANAAEKNYNNFVADMAGPKLTEITIGLITEKCKELYNDDTAERFWAKEYHVNPECPDFYFHDITKGAIPYCYATDTMRLLHEGLSYVEDYPSEKPKRYDSYIAQVIDLISELSQEHAGAIAVPDMFVNMSTFFKDVADIDRQAYEISNVFQSMIFICHRKIRPSGQSPFVNVTLADAPTLEAVFEVQEDKVLKKIKRLQILFVAELVKGLNGKPFRFPVTTANFAVDQETKEIADKEWLAELLPYIVTQRLNIYVAQDPRKFASCCRLTNDLDLLNASAGIDSFGNGGVRVGSHRVVTLNLPWLEKQGKSITEGTDLVIKILKAHREVLRDTIGKGMLKFFTKKWENLDKNFFSTIGHVGLWEAAEIRLHKRGFKTLDLDMMKRAEADILDEINLVATEMSKEFGMPINIEQIPAESAATKLAKPLGIEILSNQYVPLWEDVPVIERIIMAGELDAKSTGGAITHLNVEHVLTTKTCEKLMNMAAKAGLTHFAFNPVISVCENGHNVIGKYQQCKVCQGDIIDHLTRIIGYFVPVSKWNKGRQLEFTKRNFYKNLL